MGVTTYTGRSRRALLNKQNSTYWVGLGRTSAWDNESVPPSPSPAASGIEEAIVFKKPSTVSLCTTVASGGDFTHLSQDYAYVTDDNALTEGARYLYLSTTFDPSAGEPYGDFRQVGVFSNLAPAVGYESATYLDPANVTASGTLEYLDNATVATMGPTRQEVIEIVIEYR